MPLFRSTPLILAFVLSCALPWMGDAVSGLRGHQENELEYESTFAEVEAYLGKTNAKMLSVRFESELATIFATLPKNGRGRLARPAVRYALHRLFARHGRMVKGLEPEGGAWNDSSPTGVLSQHVPATMESLLEERLADHGFGLHELALLGTATKHLFNTEDTRRLEAAYKAQGKSTRDLVSSVDVYELLDTYMIIYILEGNFSDTSWVKRARSRMSEIYPGWRESQTWVHDVRQNLAFAERDRTNPFVTWDLDFNEVLHVVEEINEKYGSFQDIECRSLRDSLLDHELGDTGRVRLADFHGSALQGNWQFGESKAYLRQLGALDETDPQDPRVVVPNYIYSKSNCVAKSSFYSLCCINECEGLLEHVEKSLEKPDVSPQEIAAVISDLPSSTVSAPRNLSRILLQRLEAVAAINHGTIHLHSRLFSQWMHHAYPRECPYPHLSGTTHPLTSEQWLQATGERALATKEEMQYHASDASWRQVQESGDKITGEEDRGEELLPWSDEEELLYDPQVEAADGNSFLEWARALLLLVAAVAALGSMVTLLTGTAHTAWLSMVLPTTEKHFV